MFNSHTKSNQLYNYTLNPIKVMQRAPLSFMGMESEQLPTPNLSPDLNNPNEIPEDKEITTPTSNSPILNSLSFHDFSSQCFGYILIKLLGQGTFAKVYLGQCQHDGRKVAIKIMEKNKLNLECFNKEVDSLKKFKHENIVELVDSFITKQQLIIIQEYVPDGDLFDLIKRERRLSKNLILNIFQQCVKVLLYLHQNHLAHRDIKLENFILKKQGEGYLVKLADFGLSISTDGNTTLNVATGGSEEYMMPELLITSNKGHDLRKGDCWALGCILYALCYGHLPYSYNQSYSKASMFRRIALGELSFPKDVEIDMDLKKLIQGLLKQNSNHRIPLSQLIQN